MKLIIALIMLCAATATSANPFPNGNAQAGQKLFKQYNRCHAAMLGGDNSAIFAHADHKAHNATELVRQMEACNGNIGKAYAAGQAASRRVSQPLLQPEIMGVVINGVCDLTNGESTNHTARRLPENDFICAAKADALFKL
jgi:hypothetical protein